MEEQREDLVIRRGKIRLNPEMLAGLLDIPAGHMIVGIEGRFDPMCIDVFIDGPLMPVKEPDAESRILPAYMRTRFSFDWEAMKDA